MGTVRFCVMLLLLSTEVFASDLAYPSHVEGLIYPEIARTARISGEVIVSVKIDADGRVEAARALSGQLMLQEAAISNARLWRFAKAQGNKSMSIRYEFRLRKNEVTTLPCTIVEFNFPNEVIVISNPSQVQE